MLRQLFDKIDFNAIFEKQDSLINDEKLSIYGYDSFIQNLKAAQKNAKIAGVNKSINLSRVSIDWLELKFKDKKVDKIVTHLPELSKLNRRQVSKLLYEFFYQAEYVMANGLIVAVSNEDLESFAKKYKFKLLSSREVWQGKKKMVVQVYAGIQQNL